MTTVGPLRTVLATRYVTPFREGGSLPGLVEADDDGMYVVKFRGAGQGPKALVAEVIAGEIGRQLGLRVPELVHIEIDPVLGNAEPDPEIQDLLRSSGGINLGIDFLPGSLTYSPTGSDPVEPGLAAKVVWLDAYTMNVDRTPRNPNLLTWHRNLWLIDHGASLYVQHMPETMLAKTGLPFVSIAEHILLRQSAPTGEVSEQMRTALTNEILRQIVDLVPDDWFDGDSAEAATERTRYLEFLIARRDAHATFEAEIERARQRSV